MRALFACALAAAVLLGCKPGADEFFSGRPSKMAMVHNQILTGSPETMLELLRVPSRFPDASEAHIGQWQASAVAWWRHPQKHQVMNAAFKKLSRDEAAALRKWLRVRGKSQPLGELRALQEIEAAVTATAG